MSDEYWQITEFLALTAGQLQARKYWEKTFTFLDIKRKCHDIISAWHIRRNTSKQVCYAGNGSTLVFTEIWSPAAATTLDLNLAVVPLHEEYKPFVTNGYEMMHKVWSSIEEVVFQGHTSSFKVTRDKKITNFDPNWAFPDCNSSLMVPKWCTKLEVK